MQVLIAFLVSPAGRAARVVAGLALVGAGVLVGGIAGIVLALIGAVPLVAGLADVCVFAPLFGLFLSGPRTRAACAGPRA